MVYGTPKAATFRIKKIDGLSGGERFVFILFVIFGMWLTAVFGIWWFEPSHISHNWTGFWHLIDYVFFILLSYIVWQPIAMELFAWYVAADTSYPETNIIPEQNLRVAYVTAFVPGAEPYDILEKTLKAMTEVSYPHDTWLLDEGNDATAKQICTTYGVKYYSRNGKKEFNTTAGQFQARTKGGNYNSWLHHYHADYDIVAQHDVDFIPKKEFLTHTLGYFRDPTVAFVGTPQIYGNRDASWIARGAAEQTYGFYGPLQKGLYGQDMTLLIGANHIVRMNAYRDIGGYTAHIAEDMLTGMKLYTHPNKWKSVYVPEVLLVGEGPTTWASYFGQQMRWAYGCMDIVLRHAPKLLPKMRFRHIFNYVWLQQFYYSGIAQAAGVAMLTLYFCFGITSARMAAFPTILLYAYLIIYQFAFQLWLQRFNVDPKTESGLLLRGKLLSLAAWPIFFLAYIGVMRGKRLTYVVTPKGDTQEVAYVPALFKIHLLLGSITLFDIVIGLATGHDSLLLMFWAVVNTVCMLYFYLAEAVPAAGLYLEKVALQHNIVFSLARLKEYLYEPREAK